MHNSRRSCGAVSLSSVARQRCTALVMTICNGIVMDYLRAKFDSFSFGHFGFINTHIESQTDRYTHTTTVDVSNYHIDSPKTNRQIDSDCESECSNSRRLWCVGYRNMCQTCTIISKHLASQLRCLRPHGSWLFIQQSFHFHLLAASLMLSSPR